MEGIEHRDQTQKKPIAIFYWAQLPQVKGKKKKKHLRKRRKQPKKSTHPEHGVECIGASQIKHEKGAKGVAIVNPV